MSALDYKTKPYIEVLPRRRCVELDVWLSGGSTVAEALG